MFVGNFVHVKILRATPAFLPFRVAVTVDKKGTMEDEIDDDGGNELAMLDEDNTPVGYVIPYQEHFLREIVETEEIPDTNISVKFPVRKYNENRINLQQQYSNVYRVIIVERDVHYCIKSAASCLRLSKHCYGTARHVAESASGMYKFVCNQNPLVLRGLSVDRAAKSGDLVRARPENVSVTEYNRLIRLTDKDPESKQNIATQFDFSLIKTTTVNQEEIVYLVPSAEDLSKELAVAVHGYPTKQNLQKWVKKTYTEDKIPDLDSIDSFFNWNMKSVSIGNITLIEKPDSGIFSVTCAACPGFSGAPCTTIDGKGLIGFVIGSQKGNRYNFCMSVHHPVFIGEYCKHVIPDLPENYYSSLKPWIDRHRILINQICPSILAKFYE